MRQLVKRRQFWPTPFDLQPGPPPISKKASHKLMAAPAEIPTFKLVLGAFFLPTVAVYSVCHTTFQDQLHRAFLTVLFVLLYDVMLTLYRSLSPVGDGGTGKTTFVKVCSAIILRDRQIYAFLERVVFGQ
jgi:hypothetical protein